MGAGAELLAHDRELHDGLAAAGWEPTVERVGAADPAAPEVARQFGLVAELARHVAAAVDRGAFPLVVAGGCLSAVGTVAGAGARGTGVVWLDSHADLDDPEDNVSGFLDVMALSVLTGGCWRAQREAVPGHVPVPEDRVALLGVRDLAPYQRSRVERSRVHAVPGALPAGPVGAALDALARGGPRAYLHVDLDVLDAGEGAANHHATPGGPSLERVLEVVDGVFERTRVVAAALSAYDAGADADGRARAAARRIAGRVARRAREQR